MGGIVLAAIVGGQNELEVATIVDKRKERVSGGRLQ